MLAVLHCSRRVVKMGKACMGTLTFITCSTSNSDSRLPAFTILLLSCTTVNSNHRTKKVGWPGNEARPGHPEHHNGNCALWDLHIYANPTTINCMCLPSIWSCLCVLISCWNDLLPGSPITAADLCGEHCRGRPRLLNSASTTAEPGVSVLIINDLTCCIVLYFVDTDTHREANRSKKLTNILLQLQ